MKNSKRAKKYIIGALIVIFVASIALDQRMKVVNYKLETEKINESFIIAHISDLHSEYYGKNQKRLIDKIDSVNPDVILITGDLFDRKKSHENSKLFIQNIKGRYPIYYVTGNHEFSLKEREELMNFLEDSGVIVLRGDTKTISVNGDEISISGVDDPLVGVNGEFGFNAQLTNAGKEIDESKFNIFLAHRPALVSLYAKSKYDLILCGHTHGGQIRIPLLSNGLISPDQGLIPKYVGGEYKIEDSTLIISRGLARLSHHVPRVFNRPELVFIEVKRKG